MKQEEIKKEFDCISCDQTFTGHEYKKDGLMISPEFCPDCVSSYKMIDNTINQ